MPIIMKVTARQFDGNPFVLSVPGGNIKENYFDCVIELDEPLAAGESLYLCFPVGPEPEALHYNSFAPVALNVPGKDIPGQNLDQLSVTEQAPPAPAVLPQFCLGLTKNWEAEFHSHVFDYGDGDIERTEGLFIRPGPALRRKVQLEVRLGGLFHYVVGGTVISLYKVTATGDAQAPYEYGDELCVFSLSKRRCPVQIVNFVAEDYADPGMVNLRWDLINEVSYRLLPFDKEFSEKVPPEGRSVNLIADSEITLEVRNHVNGKCPGNETPTMVSKTLKIYIHKPRILTFGLSKKPGDKPVDSLRIDYGDEVYLQWEVEHNGQWAIRLDPSVIPPSLPPEKPTSLPAKGCVRLSDDMLRLGYKLSIDGPDKQAKSIRLDVNAVIDKFYFSVEGGVASTERLEFEPALKNKRIFLNWEARTLTPLYLLSPFFRTGLGPRRLVNGTISGYDERERYRDADYAYGFDLGLTPKGQVQIYPLNENEKLFAPYYYKEYIFNDSPEYVLCTAENRSKSVRLLMSDLQIRSFSHSYIHTARRWPSGPSPVETPFAVRGEKSNLYCDAANAEQAWLLYENGQCEVELKYLWRKYLPITATSPWYILRVARKDKAGRQITAESKINLTLDYPIKVNYARCKWTSQKTCQLSWDAEYAGAITDWTVGFRYYDKRNKHHCAGFSDNVKQQLKGSYNLNNYALDSNNYQMEIIFYGKHIETTVECKQV